MGAESRIGVSSEETLNATLPLEVLEPVEAALGCDRVEIWKFSSGNPLQFWESFPLRTTMKMIVGVPWTPISLPVSSQRVSLPEYPGIVLDLVVQANSSDRKNPTNRQKRIRKVCDLLFLARLGCLILVSQKEMILHCEVVFPGLICVTISLPPGSLIDVSCFPLVSE